MINIRYITLLSLLLICGCNEIRSKESLPVHTVNLDLSAVTYLVMNENPGSIITNIQYSQDGNSLTIWTALAGPIVNNAVTWKKNASKFQRIENTGKLQKVP